MLILLHNGKIGSFLSKIRLEIMVLQMYAPVPLGSITFFLEQCPLFHVELII